MKQPAGCASCARHRRTEFGIIRLTAEAAVATGIYFVSTPQAMRSPDLPEGSVL